MCTLHVYFSKQWEEFAADMDAAWFAGHNMSAFLATDPLDACVTVRVCATVRSAFAYALLPLLKSLSPAFTSLSRALAQFKAPVTNRSAAILLGCLRTVDGQTVWAISFCALMHFDPYLPPLVFSDMACVKLCMPLPLAL
jgi:hypothetical protein